MQNYHTVIFIRHGESVGNVAGECMAELEQNNYDFELTSLGRQQAEAAKKYVDANFRGQYHAGTLFASTFKRSQQTAEILGPKAQIDPRLDERWDGIFHSLPKAVILQRYPEQIVLRKKYGWYHHRAPGGENGPDIEMRILSFLRDLPDPSRVGSLTFRIASHGNWMLILERLAKDISIAEINRMKNGVEIPNGCVSTYRIAYPHIEPIKERHVPDDTLRSTNEHFA